MNTINWSELNSLDKKNILSRPATLVNENLKGTVAALIEKIRAEGDKALIELTEKFDRVQLREFKVTEQEFAQADLLVEASTKQAFQVAIENIKKFHVAQKFESITVNTIPGVTCSQVARPISQVGLYVPGGTAPLPSTVFMLAIPAQIAGCKRLVLMTPPNLQGTVDPHILVAARMLGLDEVYKLGGVQAIAAMAYGTESISKVDKIFGPGNAWVTEAKVQASQNSEGAACDMPAGPSEVLVIADELADPEFIASDLLSQAEHGADSQVLLLATSSSLIERVEECILKFTETLARKDIIKQCLENSSLILVDSIEQAIEISNVYAPEHLILQYEGAEDDLEKIESAGSVFVGAWTPESVGDYASGTNHVLPTYGYCKSMSGLNLDSFSKKMTIQSLTPQGLESLGPTVQQMASVEGLDAHKLAVSVRLERLNEQQKNGEES